jgi:hypothetical protein
VALPTDTAFPTLPVENIPTTKTNPSTPVLLGTILALGVVAVILIAFWLVRIRR